MSATEATNTSAVVVDDSRFMRRLIRTLLEEAGIEVVGEASDGDAAIDAVATHRPDVVTMDIEMPVKNGIQAVEGIMDDCPTPVLMLSAHAAEDADVTFEALERGAVDFVTKPGGEITSKMSRVRTELVAKVREAAAVDLTADAGVRRRVPVGPTDSTDSTDGSATESSRNYPDRATLVVGASTGGPGVVEALLRDLPPAANLRVLVVQHMPGGFTERFASRLDDRCRLDVREARDGDRVAPGEARVAPGGSHLVVAGDANGRLRLKLTETQPVHGVRPAIDLTMASAAETVSGTLVGALLTGMGRDGVDGLGRIRRAGGHTIAQDEGTSAIFGMPKRAIEAGCVDAVLPAEGVAAGVLGAVEGT